MHHALIVARMKPGSAPDIADVFAASDRGELPHLVGVSRRRNTKITMTTSAMVNSSVNSTSLTEARMVWVRSMMA